jgi:hypothetical protein
MNNDTKTLTEAYEQIMFEAMTLDTKYIIKLKKADGSTQVYPRKFTSASAARAVAKQIHQQDLTSIIIEPEKTTSTEIERFQINSINDHGYFDFTVSFTDKTYLNVSMRYGDFYYTVEPYLDMFEDVNDTSNQKRIKFRIPYSSSDQIRGYMDEYNKEMGTRENLPNFDKNDKVLNNKILKTLKQDKVFIDNLIKLKPKYAQHEE